nr:UDP-glycosyltransferase 90A1-like [Ipomoea batatas]
MDDGNNPGTEADVDGVEDDADHGDREWSPFIAGTCSIDFSPADLLVNSFCDLEHVCKESYNRNFVPKSWPIWKQVLYVSFGSQVEILLEQLVVIKVGLEESEVNFLWEIRTNESELHDDGFDDRLKNMGLLVPEWIDQRKILSHQSMKGFKIGVRVESCNGSVRGSTSARSTQEAQELVQGESSLVGVKPRRRFLFHGCFVINVDCMATTATEGGIADLTTRWGDMVLEDEALEFELLGDAMGVAQDGEEETWPFLD